MADNVVGPESLPEPQSYEELLKRQMLRQRLQQPQPSPEEYYKQHPDQASPQLGVNLEDAASNTPQDYYAVHPDQAPQQLGINLPSAPEPNLRKAVELRGPEQQLGLNIDTTPGGPPAQSNAAPPSAPATPAAPPPESGIPQMLQNDRAALVQRLGRPAPAKKRPYQ